MNLSGSKKHSKFQLTAVTTQLGDTEVGGKTRVFIELYGEATRRWRKVSEAQGNQVWNAGLAVTEKESGWRWRTGTVEKHTG